MGAVQAANDSRDVATAASIGGQGLLLRYLRPYRSNRVFAAACAARWRLVPARAEAWPSRAHRECRRLRCPSSAHPAGAGAPPRQSLESLYIRAYVIDVGHISIRDLQKISGEAIGALPGPTPVKSGDRTVGLLIPLKAADPDRLAAVLARAEALATRRDPASDDAALAAMGVDPTDWSVKAVRALRAKPR